MGSPYTDMFNMYHRTASENIIKAAQTGDVSKALDAIEWGVKGLRESGSGPQAALALGLIRAACDIWLVDLCTKGES